MLIFSCFSLLFPGFLTIPTHIYYTMPPGLFLTTSWLLKMVCGGD